MFPDSQIKKNYENKPKMYLYLFIKKYKIEKYII